MFTQISGILTHGRLGTCGRLCEAVDVSWRQQRFRMCTSGRCKAVKHVVCAGNGPLEPSPPYQTEKGLTPCETRPATRDIPQESTRCRPGSHALLLVLPDLFKDLPLVGAGAAKLPSPHNQPPSLPRQKGEFPPPPPLKGHGDRCLAAQAWAFWQSDGLTAPLESVRVCPSPSF